MAQPRPVFPGRVHFITRRCVGRQFLLRPSDRTKQAILYCLAEAAARPGHNVQVLWFFTMSNHLHYGLYDPDGSYPVFLAHFHKMVAKVLNCHWGRWGNLFEYEQTCVVDLADAGAVFDAMIYSLTNAVKDHLVKGADEWPGASSLQYQLDDTELVVRRPDWFFAEDSSMPEVARLRFARPPHFRHLSHAEWADMIRKAIKARERAALEERRACTPERRVMGVGAIRAQSAFDSPKTPEPRHKNRMRPRVAATNKWRRIETLQRNRAWLQAYAAARAAYVEGAYDTVFPAGTYKLFEEGHVFREAA